MPPTAPSTAAGSSATRPWRSRRWIAPALLGLAILAVVVWRLSPKHLSYYTDADRIREPVETASPRDVLWQPPARLPDEINSAADDYEPRVSADGMTLFFVRGKAGENADIYIARRLPKFALDSVEDVGPDASDGWTTPEPLAEVNSDADDLGPEPSPDGSALYFYSNRAGGLGGYDLWVARRGGTGWLAPIHLGPQVNSLFNDYGPSLSPDGTMLYFASNRPQPQDTEGPAEDAWPATIREDLFRRDYDLFSAAITDRGVGEAVPVTALNTNSNEGAPAVSPAGDFLYFATDRPGGHGGFDLYRSRRLRGDHQPPMNLGAGVNSAANELDPALSLGGFGLHFSSDRPGKALAPGAKPDYELYHTVSREVFTETQVQQAAIEWAGLWREVGPSLLLALLTLLLLLLLMRYLTRLRNRNLSLLARCLLASLFLHLLLLFLFTFWDVTASIAGAVHRRGGVKVALVSPTQGREIESQIMGALTDVRPQAMNVESARAEPTRPVFEAAPTARIEPQARPIEVHTKPLVAHVTAEAPARKTDTAQPPEPVVESEFQPDSEIRLPTVAEGARAAEATVAIEAAPPQTVPSESAATQALAASRLPDPASSALPPAHREAEPPTRLPNQNSDVNPQDAAPATALRPVALPNAVSTLDAQAPTVTLPPAEEQRISAPDQVVPGPQAVEFTAAPAASPMNPSQATSSAEVQQIDPGPSTPVAKSTASLAMAEAAAAEALPPVSERPSPMPDALSMTEPAWAEFNLPSSINSAALAASQPAQPSREPELSPGSALATQRTAPAALPGETSAEPLEPVDLPPSVKQASAASTTSLAVVADSPMEAEPALASASMTYPSGAAPLPDSPPLDLRLPTEILPPENPYAQREVEEKQELVNRMGGSDATEKAVAAALNWLAAHQSRDGRWDGDGFDRRCGECGGETDLEVDVGLTGLALLCFLGANHTAQRDGPHRDTVDRGVAWLLKLQGSDGDLRGEETMYSHGIAAIALSEAYGMTRDPRLEEPVRRALRFIEAARNTTVGGWRYDPGQAGDTSVLGWQVMALKSGQMAGITVSAEVFAAAAAWLEKVSTPARPGQYAYQPQRRASYAMTAEGFFVQQLLGRAHDEPRMIASAEHLGRRLPDWEESLDTYYWYYATLALFQHQGEIWQRWNDALTRELIDHQDTQGRSAGSWPPRGKWADKGGRVYQTALCTLMLEVYYRYLPLYSLPQPKEIAGQ